MEIDITRHLGAVKRHIESRDHNGQPARVLTAVRTFNCTPAEAWDAITNIERIPRWFLPIEGDLRVGGNFALTGNASGKIVKCEAPTSFEITWEFGGEVSWVAVQLEPSDNGCDLTLEHIAHVDSERWDQYGPGAVGIGWEMALVGLDLHLTTGKPNDAEEGMAWMMSDNGKSFTRACSDAWAEASIAAGTDPEKAREAAARTSAAYTGEG